MLLPTFWQKPVRFPFCATSLPRLSSSCFVHHLFFRNAKQRRQVVPNFLFKNINGLISGDFCFHSTVQSFNLQTTQRNPASNGSISQRSKQRKKNKWVFHLGSFFLPLFVFPSGSSVKVWFFIRGWYSSKVGIWFFFLDFSVYPKVKVREQDQDDGEDLYDQKRGYLMSLKDVQYLSLHDPGNFHSYFDPLLQLLVSLFNFWFCYLQEQKIPV